MSIRNELLEQILAKTGGGTTRADNLTGGWVALFNGDQMPIQIEAGVETQLTLDASNPNNVLDDYLPLGVTSIWNSATSQFDFSQLDVGDMVDIRVDGSMTNSGFNESFNLNLVAAIGSAGEYTLPFASGNRLFSGTAAVSRYNGVFIGSEEMRDNPAELRILTTDDASGFLIDIYVKILRLGS